MGIAVIAVVLGLLNIYLLLILRPPSLGYAAGEQAVTFADIPVMAAYLVLVGFFFVVINLVVDLLYYVVDPRLRIERERAASV